MQEQKAAESVTDDKVESSDNGLRTSAAKERITSVFHGDKEVDYKGRSWIERPQGWKEREDDLQDYLPKRFVPQART